MSVDVDAVRIKAKVLLDAGLTEIRYEPFQKVISVWDILEEDIPALLEEVVSLRGDKTDLQDRVADLVPRVESLRERLAKAEAVITMMCARETCEQCKKDADRYWREKEEADAETDE